MSLEAAAARTRLRQRLLAFGADHGGQAFLPVQPCRCAMCVWGAVWLHEAAPFYRWAREPADAVDA